MKNYPALVFAYNCDKCQIYVSPPWATYNANWVLAVLDTFIEGSSFEELERKYKLKTLW